MATVRTEKLPVDTSEDVVRVRQTVRAWAVELGFGLVDQTKVVTAASELARNTVVHGGGGTCELESLQVENRRGLRLTFVDQGPGIVDIDQAMRDGFTSGNGLGLGLGGARRLSSEFDIRSQPGAGTLVQIVRWK